MVWGLQGRRLAVGTAVAVLVAGLGAVAVERASAATAQVGNDISWPQCSVAQGGYANPMPADSTGFVVLGLTNGLPFTENPCLADQARWIRERSRPFHAYTFTAYPTQAEIDQYGGGGQDAVVALRNVGLAQAASAVASLKKIGLRPDRIWVDVETRSRQPWPTGGADPAATQKANQAVIEGIVAGLQKQGLAVGIYSNANGWSTITGGWQRPDLPFWATVGAKDQATAAAKCSAPGLNGGPVHLAQWWTTSPAVDWNIACPGHELAAPKDTLAWPSVAPGRGWSTSDAAGFTVTAGPSRTQDWALKVTDACTGATVATRSGTTSDLISVGWDGRPDGGSSVRPGVYRGVLRSGSAPAVTTLQEVAAYGSTRVSGCRTTRVSGADAYATAVQVGRVTYPSARTVVLASGASGRVLDAVTAAPYARLIKAPLLLTDPVTLPDVVAADLQARGATDVVVVGGTAAVTSSVTDRLAALGLRVSRVAGKDQYETAALLAKRFPGPRKEVVVTSGAAASLADALVASGPAAGLGIPVLLTGATSVPPSTQSALRSLSSRTTTTITVVGPTTAVSSGVLTTLKARAKAVRRIGSTDLASETSALATAYATRLGSGGVVVATPGSPATLLAAASLGRVVLVAGPAGAGTLPSMTSTWLARHPGTSVRVVGSPNLVPPAVLVQIGR